MTALPAYIIACTPRSGSWLMCDCLRSAAVAGRPGEYAVADDVATWKGHYRFDTHREYFDRLRDTHASANGVVGLKLMWWQFEGFRLEADGYLGGATPAFDRLREVIGPVHVIWLRRRDVLRQAVSWARAQQSGQWSRWADERTDSRGVPTHYDAAQVHECVARIHRDNARWRAALADAGLPALNVWYEDLAEHPAAVVEDVLRYIGVAGGRVGAEIVPRLGRQADDETEEWVARAELDTDLVDTGLYDPGRPGARPRSNDCRYLG